MKLLGLGGLPESGKDVIADHLVEAHGFVKIGMSDVLNEALIKLDPRVEGEHGVAYRYSTLIDYYGYTEAKAKFPEVRRLLRVLGTEVGRDLLGEDTWVKAVDAKIYRIGVAGNRNVVVTGIRYPNELRMIKQYGAGVAWWIDRPNHNTRSEHTSDNALAETDFDRTIINNGTLDGLRALVDYWVEAEEF